MSPRTIQLTVRGISCRAVLLEAENPVTVEAVVSQLPINSFCCHPNVSGKGMFVPTKTIFTGKGYMVDREPGSVYFYAPSGALCCTYGETSEVAKVNTFARVIPEDLEKIRHIGQLVYEKTLAQAPYEEVKVSVSVLDADGNPIQKAPSTTPVPKFDGHWAEAKAFFDHEADLLLQRTPDQVVKVFEGIIDSGMGTGQQSLTVNMHIWAYLMLDGPNILYRFLTDSHDDEMTPGLLVRITRRHLLQPFSHPEFLANLGLTQFERYGSVYDRALDSLDTKDREKGLEAYYKLTASYLTVINLTHKRVQQRFPFFLGKAFPHRKPAEIYTITKILFKEIINNERPLPEDDETFPRSEIIKLSTLLNTSPTDQLL